MISKNNIAPSEYENTDVNMWAKESFELSQNNVYPSKLNFSF